MLQKLKNRKNNQEGFTIIEVLIVLAIAGLIMLIVFLAVPALQRSARNTQRREDAAAIGAAVANFIDDNGGTLPISLGKDADATQLDLCSKGGAATGGGTICTAGTNIETAKLGYYVPTQISIDTASTGTDTETSSSAVIIVESYGCNANNTGLSATSNPRTAAILYATESSGGTTAAQCLEQ